MNINSFPDVVLRHIFSYLPLLDQILLRRICSKWKSLQIGVTATRKSLTLFIGELSDPPPQLLITESFLKIPHLDQIESYSSRKESTLELSELYYDLTALLVCLFPSISSLCLVLNESDYETVDQVILLLNCWSKSLKSLSFHCHFDEDLDEDLDMFDDDDDLNAVGNVLENVSSKKLLKLIRFIDERCLALDCLTFDVSEELFQVKDANLDLSCLTRLKEFQFCSKDDASILFRSLKRYGASDRLEKISIGNYNYTYKRAGDVVTKFAHKPQIAAKFCALPHLPMPKEPQLLADFKSLTTLWFDLGDLTLRKLTFYLAPLRSLLYLNLTITDNELSQYDATPTFDFHPLTSVKILSLEISMRSHAELSSRHWPIIFPSIQFVQIYTLSEICSVCLPSFEVNPHFPIQVEHIIQKSIKKECLTMLLAPLKQCGQLKKIVTYSSRDTSYEIDDTRKWTFEKLTNEWVCDLHSN